MSKREPLAGVALDVGPPILARRRLQSKILAQRATYYAVKDQTTNAWGTLIRLLRVSQTND